MILRLKSMEDTVGSDEDCNSYEGPMAGEDRRFRDDCTRGKVSLDNHYNLLRHTYINLLFPANPSSPTRIAFGTVFSKVDILHVYKLSFGKGQLKFNRTLDVFYYSQMYAAVRRNPNKKTPPTSFKDVYELYYDLIGENVWQQYYTSSFLLQSATARFWRLPNLRDLPDLYWYRDHLSEPEAQVAGPLTKLPYWANNVNATYWRQPILSREKMIEIALATLEQTIKKQRSDYHNLEPFSLTQARYWLKRMGLYDGSARCGEQSIFSLYPISEEIADDWVDVLGWKHSYTPETWHSKEAKTTFVESDVKGFQRSLYTGPSPRIDISQPRSLDFARGWTPEIGSEEEILFLANVAYEELADYSDPEDLNLKHRSHILMAVLCASLGRDTKDQEIGLTSVKRRIIAAGRRENKEATELWVSQVMSIMRPYVAGFRIGLSTGSASIRQKAEGRRQLLKQILIDNGQLFGRHRQDSWSRKETAFGLKSGQGRRVKQPE